MEGAVKEERMRGVIEGEQEGSGVIADCLTKVGSTEEGHRQ